MRISNLWFYWMKPTEALFSDRVVHHLIYRTDSSRFPMSLGHNVRPIRWNVPPFFQSMTPSARTIRVAIACTGRRSPEPKWLFSTLQITRTELRTIRWIGPHPFHKISQRITTKPKLHSNFSSLKLIRRKEERNTSSSVDFLSRRSRRSSSFSPQKINRTNKHMK